MLNEIGHHLFTIMTIYKAILALYVLLATFTYSITARKEFKYTISSYNNCLQSDHVLSMIAQVSLSQCVDECAVRTSCLAVNYFNRYHLCELLLNDNGVSFKSSAKTHSCIFIKKTAMDIKKVGEKCSCGAGKKCVSEPDGLCTIEECESLTIQNGQVRGNMRAIRDLIRYECDHIYVSTFQESEATCQQNGTWSYKPVCKQDSEGNDICSGCVLPRDCQDIQTVHENAETGVYMIHPTGNDSFKVRCDMDTPPGGWTVFQRRESNSNFENNWQDYKEGFGNLDSNFWLGNDKIWKLTSSNQYKLRVDLRDQNGDTGFAEYSSFSIGDESTKYILNISGHSGTATDSLAERHNGMKFTTIDQEHDTSIYHNCAEYYKGGWWYCDCQSSNLNGPYGDFKCNRGMTWKDWRDPCVFMRFTEIKIRRK